MDKIPDGKLRELADPEKEKDKLLRRIISMIKDDSFEGVIIISLLNDEKHEKEVMSGNYIFLQCSIPNSLSLLGTISEDMKDAINDLTIRQRTRGD